MEEFTIQVNNLTKVFTKQVRQKGLLGMIKSLFSTKKVKFTAVNNISFSIKKGEMVAYIGANGAGKSTTIKMMTGILTPTSGEVLIDGLKPYDSKKRNEDFNERFTYLRKTLELEKFIQSPVRTLSLGQRMRADLAASLIHNPEILFLDEPTIGLDVLVKEHIIKAIKEINEKYNTTVILTTHDMNDIISLCNRVIIIDEGKILFDGHIDEVKNRFGNIKNIFLSSNNFVADKLLSIYPEILIDNENNNIKIEFDADKTNINDLMKTIFDCGDIKDISIKENDLSNVVKQIYENKAF